MEGAAGQGGEPDDRVEHSDNGSFLTVRESWNHVASGLFGVVSHLPQHGAAN